MPEIRRVAILDDYQHTADRYADWESLPEGSRLTWFHKHLGDHEEVIAALEPFDVVVAMRERTPFPAEVLDRLPNLRLLVTTGPANAAIDTAAAARRGIVVSGTRGAGLTSTAELTWGLLHALTRSLPAEERGLREGGWQRTVGRDLYGARLGVIGLGGVGGRVARVGVAFGMDVVAWSAHLDPDHARALGVTPVTQRELLTTSDVVTLHVRLSPRTVGLIGAEELALMRRDALLVNTSRAPVVDERALLAALHAGTLGGAALDVHVTEPLPTDSPWYGAPRTVLTPHLGYVTADAYEVFYRDALDDILAYAADEPVRLITP
ncbi:D-2-hydroxyacid dehydrogenase family protein [Streptomyces tsukubensis]|uniref:Hydroxyacid dehydrogenase n=1 Tax=Streptomyces tsukubensis TaxID=83656 RepID=A0A1V4A453_9ACTN|nr:D-2-hydroxyacid dehydrogenase family protein [Streptomyces tsukubensis]OON75344.1 hydroxyacid dehydrogenase [Streptomyces tsukubensis]QFR95025.1 D-2-hydroxyacid dehydrogenase family protein [Streptomyces tsukubensis]